MVHEVEDQILVADADARARGELANLLRNAGYGVLESSTGAETIELTRTRLPAALILEITLPDVSGYEVCRVVRSELGPDVSIMFLSGHRTEPYDRVAGLLIGADDYVTKPYAPDEILARLRNLLHRAPPATPSTAHRLTGREHEVLTLLASGLQQSEIARRLFISPKTVASHIENVLRKLGVRSRAQAIAVAYREDLVRPAPTTIGEGASGGGGRPPSR